MMTLAGKYGPPPFPEMDRAAAEGRLEAYMRIVQAALEGRDGPLQAPALHLSDAQLVALFSPQQLTVLVQRPLSRPAHECEAQN
jgi:hypothetical protein